MRILMTADAVGGVWHYALELARGLQEIDGDVAVALAVMGDSPGPEERREALNIPRLSFHPLGCRLEWMSGAEADLQEASARLLELASDVGADLVHVNDYYHASLPWNRPVVVAAHSCVPSWWEAVHGEPAPSSWDGYRRWVRRGLTAADRVVAPSRSMLATLERLHGRCRRAKVIYNGRTLPLKAARWKDPLVLGAGRLWDEAKGLPVLAELALRLEWPVWIAGEANHPDPAQDAVVAARDGANFLGRLPSGELEEWMRRASIYCLPARYEPFGLTPLEAALCGCALVLSDIPTFREIWSGAAELVDPQDPDALARTLSRLIEDEDRRSRCASLCFRRARRFTRRRMAGSYWRLYRKLLDGGRSSFPESRKRSAMVHG